MRSDVDNLINVVSSQIWDAWSNTNNALARRAAETLEAKSKLQMHLHKVYILLRGVYNEKRLSQGLMLWPLLFMYKLVWI